MIYALVIVRARTRVEELTYRVPVDIIPYIRPGSLVVIPLRRKRVEGVVVRLTKRIAQELKTVVKDILSIDRRLGHEQRQIRTVEYLARHSYASLGEAASAYLKYPIDRSMPISSDTSQVYFCQGAAKNRLNAYLSLIKQNRATVLVVPVELRVDKVVNFFESQGMRVVSLKESRTSYQQSIEELRRGGCVVGSYSAALLPLPVGGTLILDDVYHVAARARRRPFFTLKELGLARAVTEKISIVLGAPVMAAEDIVQAKRSRWVRLECHEGLPNIAVVSQEKSNCLPKSVVDSFQIMRERVNIVVNGVDGEFQGLFCPSCNEVVAQDNISICPKCGEAKLIGLGCGMRGIKQHFKTQLPQKIEEKIIYKTQYPSFDLGSESLVVVTDVDRYLFSQDYRQIWRLFGQLVEITEYGKVIIVSSSIDHPIFSYLGKLDRTGFLASQLLQRRTYRLPPYRVAYELIGPISERSEIQPILERSFYEVIEDKSSQGQARLTVLSTDRAEKVFRVFKELLPRSWYCYRQV